MGEEETRINFHYVGFCVLIQTGSQETRKAIKERLQTLNQMIDLEQQVRKED